MQAIKTLFLGSNWESLETLKILHLDPRFEVIGVITPPDKPVGRKRVMTPSLVKKFAVSKNIPVFHTDRSKEKYHEAMDKFNPELIVVKAFGEIIPGFFLEKPQYKAINIHFSLLPKYRGAVPIQSAILNGDKKTGISIIQMVEKLDAGGILAQFEEPINETDTNESLRQRLVQKSTEVIGDILEKWCKGEIEAVVPKIDKKSFVWEKDIAKDKAEINWGTMDPEYIERMIRAFIPWPVAWTIHEGKRVKIFKSHLVEAGDIELKPGEFKTHQERLFIGTKDKRKLLQVLELQMEGSRRMTAGEFTRGRDI